jgi:hypothetical protein
MDQHLNYHLAKVHAAELIRRTPAPASLKRGPSRRNTSQVAIRRIAHRIPHTATAGIPTATRAVDVCDRLAAPMRPGRDLRLSGSRPRRQH